jgi:hypothetical protein
MMIVDQLVESVIGKDNEILWGNLSNASVAITDPIHEFPWSRIQVNYSLYYSIAPFKEVLSDWD